MFYTYVIQSLKDGNLYTGFTSDLQERFQKHNRGLMLSTKHRRPFRLIYYEACLMKEDARTREKYLKSGIGKRYLKQRLKTYFDKFKGSK